MSKPLHILFKNCLENECFPNEWKKANIVHGHKKGDKQLINNYRPVPLLPICAKVLKEITYNSLFELLDTNKPPNDNQSGFWPGDSCMHQLPWVAHEIYKVFDVNPSLEVRGVFLDLSKTFDRAWREGLMYKLKCLGVYGKHCGLMQSFLSDRFQRVALNDQTGATLKLRFPRVPY